MKKNKKLVMNLIKDDLIHTHLVYGLETLGLSAGNYYLSLNESIFKLAGIKEDKEDFFEKYIEECKKVHNLDIFNNPELLNDIVHCLYEKLKKEYKAQKNEK